MKSTKITLKQARRVLEVVDAGLSNGLGKPQLGEMCVEAAVCFALGQPHGDQPACVAPIVRQFKIALNDASGWSSKAARAKGLRRIAIAQLGSTGIDENAFAKALAEQTIRLVVPAALRASAGMPGNASHKAALLAAADRCEKEGSAAASYAARAAASDASDAASDAASYAASAAASDASDAASAAASYAARAAASYAASYASYAASYAASAAASDAMLTLAAEAGVQALRMIGAAGIALMDKLIGP
jgi:hypothetical protein